MKRSHAVLAALGFFLAGIALRLPGLGNFLTPDEHLWAERTGQFLVSILRHDWANTVTSGHPGVTTTWAGSAGLALKWLFDRPSGMGSLGDLANAVNQGPLQRDLLTCLRLPVVLLCAAGVACVYLLARRLLTETVALLGTVILLCDPFFLAHSRVLHLDALVTTSITIAWLALLLATRTRRRGYYVLAGLVLGFGILTKSPALALGPLVAGWVIYANWQRRGNLRAALLPSASDLVWLGLPALAVVFALWPALWIDPVASASRVLTLMLTYAETSHELGNFWLGRSVDDPGPLFYGAVILWRSMPVVLLGLVLSLGYSLRNSLPLKSSPAEAANAEGSGVEVKRHPTLGRQMPETSAIGALWILVMWFVAIQTLGAKKFDRYLLPVFPALDLLAAWGWVCALQTVQRWLATRKEARRGGFSAAVPAGFGGRHFGLGVLLLLAASQAAAALLASPNYLDAYNPMLGGMRVARQMILVGWGEGLEGPANWLNRKEAGVPRVASWYGSVVFSPFYSGESFDLLNATASDLYANDVDYVVTYVNQLQRDLLDQAIRAILGNPVYVESRQGVAMAQVYRWPKPFSHTTDRPIAPGLQLLGWDGPRYDQDPRQVQTVLHWDATALGEHGGAPVSAWLKDSNGEVWARAEAGVPDGEGSVGPAWGGRQAVTQTVALQAPVGLLAGNYRMEIAAGDHIQNVGNIEIPPTRLDQLAANPTQSAWQMAMGSPTWAGDLRLAGYTLERQEGTITLDLLWAPGQQMAHGAQLFVHVAGPNDQLVAQTDVPLEPPGGSSQVAWQAGNMIRRRVRLVLPQNIPPGPYRLYTGLYKPDGPRLPLSANGTPIADGRYLLQTF